MPGTPRTSSEVFRGLAEKTYEVSLNEHRDFSWTKRLWNPNHPSWWCYWYLFKDTETLVEAADVPLRGNPIESMWFSQKIWRLFWARRDCPVISIRTSLWRWTLWPCTRGEEKRTSCELREIWQKAILQQILLLKMEKENQKLQASENDLLNKCLKLDYRKKLILVLKK